MTEMIERIARVLEPQAWTALGIGDTLAYANRRTSSLRKARRALEAIREPTEHIATHPMATCYNTGEYGDKEVRRIWRSMVDAALDQSPQDMKHD